MAAPVLAAGDGALGLWSAVREVFPETREQRCWWHKIGCVLNALPKSARPGAKKALAGIWNAEDKGHAQAAASVFAADYGTRWPNARAVCGIRVCAAAGKGHDRHLTRPA